MSTVSTFLPISVTFYFVELSANTRQIGHDFMTVMFDLLHHPRMAVMRVIILHPYTTFDVCRPSLSEDWHIFRLSINRPRDLELLTST